MATTSERIARVLLKVQTDRTELTNTRQQLDAFNKTLADLERQKALSRLATDSAKAVQEGKSLRTELGRMKAELVKFGASSSEVSKVVREFDRLNESASRAAASASAGTGNKLLRSIGTDIRNLPAVNIPGAGISTDVVGKILNTIGRLNVDLKTLAISGGIAAGAIIAVGVAFQNFQNTVQPVVALLKEVIAARQAAAGVLAANKSEEIIGKFEAAQQELIRLEAERVQAITDTATVLGNARNLTGLEGLLADVGVGLGELGTGPVADMIHNISELDKTIASQNITVDALREAYEKATAAAEAERLEKERLRLLDAAAQSRLQAILQAEQSNAQAIRERIDALNFEQAAILKLMRTNEISVELSEQLTQRSRDINEQLKAFSDALPEKERLEAAKALFDRIREGITKFAEDTAKAFKDLQKVTGEIGELKSEFKQKIIDIQNKLAEALAEAARDRDIALSEASREADMARTEAVREAGLERAEIERDSQIAIQKILRRSKNDINSAIANRDAVALQNARDRRDEELAAEDSNRAERLRKLDIELREQLRTIDLRLKEQNRTIAMRYDEQVRRARIAAEQSIRLETEKYNKELALKTQEISRILQLEQQKIVATINGATATLGITANFWQNMVTVAQNAVKALGTAGASVVRPAGNPSSGGARIPSLDTGGRIMSDGLIYAHKGEYVTNPKRGQGQGQIVFAPQINGMGKAAVRREILRQFDQWEDEVFS
jgi:hypothetical protein